MYISYVYFLIECDESCYIVNGAISCVFVNVNECLSFDAHYVFVIRTVSCMPMNFKVCLEYAIHYYVHGECGIMCSYSISCFQNLWVYLV